MSKLPCWQIYTFSAYSCAYYILFWWVFIWIAVNTVNMCWMVDTWNELKVYFNSYLYDLLRNNEKLWWVGQKWKLESFVVLHERGSLACRERSTLQSCWPRSGFPYYNPTNPDLEGSSYQPPGGRAEQLCGYVSREPSPIQS